MLKLKLNKVLLAIATASIAHAAMAATATAPLLNKSNTVSPNLTVILDTSGSMDGDYIYQYGTLDPSGMGPQGPGKGSDNNYYGKYSPDINRIYYDPRVRYLPRIKYDGTNLTADAPASFGWKVYFRNTTMTPTAACPAGAYANGTAANKACYYNPSYTPPVAVLAKDNLGNVATAHPYPNDTSSATAATKFPKFTNRTDCASLTGCTATEERQNRSNWNKWYSSRGDMAVTGLGAAFEPLADDSIRLGWTSIKYINDNSKLDRGVSSYSPASGNTKDQFFTWLYSRAWGSGTPNRVAVDRVGKYYSRKDNAGPWADTPNPSSTGIASGTEDTSHASCRRSFSMLITDGYTNGGTPSVGNVDKDAINIPNANGTFPYKQPLTGSVASAPYTDIYSNTMADIAMEYWGKDLRTNLLNKVPPIDTMTVKNPSTWQNVSFYAVTLGIDGTLPHTTTTLANLQSGSQPWPKPVDNEPTTIDDLWHATINARGELLNANNSQELTAGMTRMFSTIAGLPQTLSGVATSSPYVTNGNRKFKPEYIPNEWSGRLSAIELDGATGNEKIPANVYWQVESGTDVNGDPISLIPAYGSRNVVTWNGTSGVTFNAANSGLSTDLVNYIKGDSSNELRKSGGTYRSRKAVLGDIINSEPAYVKNNIDMGYSTLGIAGYPAYLAAKGARSEGLLFAGANDGMLHTFRESTGVEVFAFVPKALHTKLVQLTQTPYDHQYFVDGPITEADAFLDSTWTNVVTGTTGLGEKSVFALKVNLTTPTTMNASNVLWEVNSSTASFSNLGHVLGNVQTGKMEGLSGGANGGFVAIFGNGVASSSGKASLFVVNLKTGALLKEIVVDGTSANGLSGARLVLDATNAIVGAYAGDLKGNLWRFNLTGAASTWRASFSGAAMASGANPSASITPLFKGKATQPITATPLVVPHPNGGYVVAFGTGRFFDTADGTGPYTQQSLYGIWDKQAFVPVEPVVVGATVDVNLGSSSATVAGLDTLQVQTATNITGVTGLVDDDWIKISSNPVTWGDGLLTNKRGWYLDLPLPSFSQRSVYPFKRAFPRNPKNTFMLVPTLSPESPTNPDLCAVSGAGTGWMYIIDAVSGSGPTKQSMDTNGDGVIDATDEVVGGYKDKVDGGVQVLENGKDKVCVVSSEATCKGIALKCGQVGAEACPVGASTLKKREWRQLYMR